MAQNPQPLLPTVIDPDRVPETLCDGQFCAIVVGHLTTLVFTHVRPDPGPMFATGTFTPSAVVRARIVLTTPNLVALKDYLTGLVQRIEAGNAPAPEAGGAPTKH